ncbi:MAG TPA: HD domain-containing protein [Pirellulaceae bacterium]|nr:HD domain-containing protein [Pirellulaceae bacterium]
MGKIAIPDVVLRARQRWLEGYERIRAQHEEGVAGRRTVQSLSDLLDALLLDLHRGWDGELEALEHQVAIVLHGGSGRREYAPRSDIDLMILHQGRLTEPLTQYSQYLIRAITDAHFKLGHSLRSLRDAMTLALRDPQVFSSLTESRFLVGNHELFLNFVQQLKRLSQRHQTSLLEGLIQARLDERNQFGETVFLLRPNIKRSPGTLRDWHLIRWLGFVRFGETDVDQLCRHGAISSSDATAVQQVTEFLLRIRCDLHFQAQRAEDVLGRNQQVRLAEKFGLTGSEGVLPVEQMMQEYFRRTSELLQISDLFVELSRSRRTVAQAMLDKLTTRQLEGKFRMSLAEIGVLPTVRDTACRDLSSILRLIQLAVQHQKTVERETRLAIREAMRDLSAVTLDEDAARQFVSMLSEPAGLGRALRTLHEVGALERIVPAVAHTRGLLQFNEYHKYTVDEHTLRAVEICTDFQTDQTLVGEVYRQLPDRHVLHLALLLHDLGKGYAEEHCEVGRRIALEVCQLLLLSNEETEAVTFLVHNHLMMSHLAFHRDIGDEAMVAEFVGNVGSVQWLSKLFLLTIADIDAVGPDVLNPWKMELLTGLYRNAYAQLTGRNATELIDPRFEVIYERVAELADDDSTRHWLRRAAQSLPWNYCSGRSAEEVAAQLLDLKYSKPGDVQCWIKPTQRGRLIELCITKHEQIRAGIFYKITGLLASSGLSIQAADIKPLGESLIWYWFQFEDIEFAEPPVDRLTEIVRRADAIASGLDEAPPKFTQRWEKQAGPAARLTRPEIRVEIDNHTVESATIIDIFAYNKLGFLYAVSRKIFELGLDVRFARVSTYGRQVMDVFYVTDDRGRKIRNRARLNTIRRQLVATAKAFLKEDTPPITES